MTGKVASETVTLGSFQVVSQVFGTYRVSRICFFTYIERLGLADETQDMMLSSSGNSGVLGLSFPPAASIPMTSGKTVLDNIFSYLDESRRFFAFKLGRQSGTNDSGSSLTIGQLDPEFAQDMSGFLFTEVSRAGADVYDFWKLPLKRLTLNSTDFPLSPSRTPGAKTPIAVLDSGTTLLLGPQTDVDNFYAATGSAAKKNEQSGIWQVSCRKSLVVGVVLGEEREFLIDPADISWAEGGSSDGWCMGGIQANDDVSSCLRLIH